MKQKVVEIHGGAEEVQKAINQLNFEDYKVVAAVSPEEFIIILIAEYVE